jgi:hypothetical protein
MEVLRRKLEKIPPLTMALYALGAGISFFVLRQLWINVRKKVSITVTLDLSPHLQAGQTFRSDQ